MTNTELIAKIKVEIEKRITDNTFGAKLELIDILAWLDTLESEKPVPNDLDFEQELYNRFGQIKDFTLGMRIGQYFYELGCRRTAEKYNEIEYNRQRAEESIPKDLEEAANKFAVFYDQGTCDGIAQDCFIAGAKWKKEQMMKEGDEGIVRRAGPIGYITFTDEQQFNSRLEQFQDCDRVRIIIVKED